MEAYVSPKGSVIPGLRAASVILTALLWWGGCGGDSGQGRTVDGSVDGAQDASVVEDASVVPDATVWRDGDVEQDGADDNDAVSIEDAGADGGVDGAFTVVTFNTGTTDTLDHSSDGDDYGQQQVAYSDQYYGNGLAWSAAVTAVTDWFTARQPDIVGFQEIFYSENCTAIPSQAQVGYVCETWSPGDATVARVLLGSGYQVACHPGKPDKCVAVKKSFGTIRQCPDPDFCLEGLDGEIIPGCGSGARVARATIDLVGGDVITVVHIHASSGESSEDQQCRVQQVEQIFVDMDGEPGANGARNIILGDLNVDPGRVPGFLDDSSEAWNDYVGGTQPFQWVSPIGFSATPTYLDTLNIDHVVSDFFSGPCYAPG